MFAGSYGIQVVNGTDAYLKCKWCPLPGVSFVWERMGDDLPSNRTEKGNCSLVIKETTLEDTGNYTCIGRSKSTSSALVLKEQIPLVVRG